MLGLQIKCGFFLMAVDRVAYNMCAREVDKIY